MKTYQLTVKTLSDTMIGSGQSVPALIDSDVRYDDYGFPYMGAKTLKGFLREQMELIKKYDSAFEGIDIDELLGRHNSDLNTGGRLHFSDLSLGQGLKNYYRKEVDNGAISKTELLNAFTVVYSYTSIDEKTGVAKDHSLRRERMVKKGIVLTSEIELIDDGLTESKKYEELLKKSVRSLQHIGTHRSKGKGAVSCVLEEKVAR